MPRRALAQTKVDVVQRETGHPVKTWVKVLAQLAAGELESVEPEFGRWLRRGKELLRASAVSPAAASASKAKKKLGPGRKRAARPAKGTASGAAKAPRRSSRAAAKQPRRDEAPAVSETETVEAER